MPAKQKLGTCGPLRIPRACQLSFFNIFEQSRYIERAGPTGPVYHCIVCMGAGWARSWKRHCETRHIGFKSRDKKRQNVWHLHLQLSMTCLSMKIWTTMNKTWVIPHKSKVKMVLHKTRVWERIYVFMRLHDEVQPDTNVCKEPLDFYC
ncbi:hypothetical protein H4Q26_002490 [Puccinia striiformis f. sp. tritici PST-130]|nr:hypothetical protein H4Q26_002490 [Puccinia striiformis f. sp. tritici PST-130]